MTETKKITFVIDTDSYAGHFGREMAEFITGIPYEIGGQYGTSPHLGELIEWRHIEEDNYYHDAVYRIVITPKYSQYNSVGIFLSRRPTSAEVAILKARAERFSDTKKERLTGKPYCNITGFRFITEAKP